MDIITSQAHISELSNGGNIIEDKHNGVKDKKIKYHNI